MTCLPDHEKRELLAQCYEKHGMTAHAKNIRDGFFVGLEAIFLAMWRFRSEFPIGCHAGRDGDCNWEHCPQVRDGESMKSGRHCPLDIAFPPEDE